MTKKTNDFGDNDDISKKKSACGFTKISPEVLKKLREFSTFDAIGFFWSD